MTPTAWWQAHDHPVWTLTKIVVLAICALALSYGNASSFDSGEVFSALGSFALGKMATGK